MYRIELLFTLEMLVLELICVPEQDCSAALLKAERIKLDRFLKQSRPSLNTFVELKLQQGFLLVNSRLQQLGPDLIRKQLSVACSPVHAFQAEEQAEPIMDVLRVHTVLETVQKSIWFNANIGFGSLSAGGAQQLKLLPLNCLQRTSDNDGTTIESFLL